MQPLVIGITGGIGSGKSTIAHFFTVLGYPVYNSDERAKEIYFNDEVKKEVVSLLGKEAYPDEKTLNKKFIADKIFSDKDALAKLNNIIHPAVKKDFDLWKEQHRDKKIIIKESALLFETGIYKSCNKNILVTADEETRIQRVMQRDKLKREEVVNKMKNQWKDDDKIKLADLVLANDGTVLILPKILKWLSDSGLRTSDFS